MALERPFWRWPRRDKASKPRGLARWPHDLRRRRAPAYSEETPARTYTQPEGDWVRAAQQFISPPRDGFVDDDTTQEFRRPAERWIEDARDVITPEGSSLEPAPAPQAAPRAAGRSRAYDLDLDDEHTGVWRASAVVSGVSDVLRVDQTAHGMPRVDPEEARQRRALQAALTSATASALGAAAARASMNDDGGEEDEDGETLVLKRPVAPNVSSGFFMRLDGSPRAYKLHDVDDIDGELLTPNFDRPRAEWITRARDLFARHMRDVNDEPTEEQFEQISAELARCKTSTGARPPADWIKRARAQFVEEWGLDAGCASTADSPSARRRAASGASSGLALTGLSEPPLAVVEAATASRRARRARRQARAALAEARARARRWRLLALLALALAGLSLLVVLLA